MGRDGRATKTAILDAAEALILDQGFAATSVDSVIERAGLTKGTFFYHYKSKADLAHALVERYAARDAEILESTMDRAEALAREPLQQVLVFVGLLREHVAAIAQPNPGCLFASYLYEADLFDERTLGIIREAMCHWRRRLGAKLAQAAERRPPALPVDLDGLADMLTVVLEGAYVMARTLSEPGALAAQLDHYRNYLELLFAPR